MPPNPLDAVPLPAAAAGGTAAAAVYLPGQLKPWNTGWPWPLDAVQGFFEWVANLVSGIWGMASNVLFRIWDAAIWVKDRIWGFITTLWGWIWPRFQWVLDRVWGFFTTLWGWVWPKLQWVFDRVGAMAGWLWDKVWGGLTWVWDRVWGGLQWVAEVARNIGPWITERLWDAIRWIRDRVNEFTTWLWQQIAGRFWPWVGQQFSNLGSWLDFQLRNPESDLRREISGMPLSTLNRLLEPGGDYLPAMETPVRVVMGGAQAEFASTFQGWWDSMLEWFRLFTTWAATDLLPTIWGGIQGAVGWILDIFKKVMGGFTDAILALGTHFSPVTPDQSPGIMSGALGIAFASAASLGAMTIGGSLMHPLKELGFGHVSAMLGDVVGYREISLRSLGPLLDAMLRIPSTYHFLGQFRPVIPRSAELEILWSKHEINQKQFRQWGAWTGWSEEIMSIFESALYKDPRLMELVRLSEVYLPRGSPPSHVAAWLQRAGLIPADLTDWWLTYKMAKAGYEGVDVPILVAAAKARAMMTANTLYMMQVRRFARDGLIDGQQQQELLAPVVINPQAMDRRLDAMALEVEYEETADMLGLYIDQFRKDIITETDLAAALRGLGVTPQRVSFIIAKEKVRKLPKPAAPAKAVVERTLREQQTAWIAVYKEQRRLGLLSDDDFRRQLLALGVTQNYAEALVQMESLRSDKAQQATAVAQALAASRALQAALARLALARFQADLINQASLIQALTLVGYTQSLAEASAQLEQVRKTTRLTDQQRREAQATLDQIERTQAALLRERFQTGILTQQQLQAALVAAGVDPDLAAAMAQLEAARLQRRQLSDQVRDAEARLEQIERLEIATLRQQFQAGALTETQLYQALLQLLEDKPLARAITDLEVAKALE